MKPGSLWDSDLWVPTVGLLEVVNLSLKSIYLVERQGPSALIGVEAKRLSVGMGFFVDVLGRKMLRW